MVGGCRARRARRFHVLLVREPLSNDRKASPCGPFRTDFKALGIGKEIEVREMQRPHAEVLGLFEWWYFDGVVVGPMGPCSWYDSVIIGYIRIRHKAEP